MALLAPQADFAASTDVLEQALSLPETSAHLLKHIKVLLLKYSYQSRQSREEEARDLTQICLMKALEKKHHFDASQNVPGAWLHGFAVNIVREHLRFLGRLRRQLTNASEVLASTMQTDDEKDTLHFQNEFIQSVMQHFTAEEQRLIQIYVVEQFTQREIAQALQLSAIATRVRLTRVRMKLRNLYQQAIKEHAS